jgi:hypothetical protein
VITLFLEHVLQLAYPNQLLIPEHLLLLVLMSPLCLALSLFADVFYCTGAYQVGGTLQMSICYQHLGDGGHLAHSSNSDLPSTCHDLQGAQESAYRPPDPCVAWQCGDRPL